MESEKINKGLETKKRVFRENLCEIKEEAEGRDAVTFYLDVLLPDPPSLFSYHFPSLFCGLSIIVSVAMLTPVLLYRNTPPGHFVQ